MGLLPERREMVDVELDDGAATDAPQRPDPPRAGTRQAPVRTPGRSVRLARRVGIGALVVVVVVTTLVVTRLRSAGPDVTALAGAAPSLISPLEETWRVDVPHGWSVVDDLLLTTVRDPAGLRVQAYDVASGSARWSLALPAGTTVAQCPVAVDGPDGRLVACQALGALVPRPGPGRGAAQDPGHLLLVSSADGTVHRDVVLGFDHVGFGEVLGDLVTAHVAGGGVDVTRRDVTTDEVVWQVPVPLRDAQAVPATRLVTQDDAVLVTGPTTALLDPADGRAVGVWQAVERRSHHTSRPEVTLAPHGFAVRTDGAARAATTSWYTPGGRLVGEFDGAVSEPAATDGSAPEVVLLATSGWGALRGLDVRRGEALWSVDLDEGHPVLRFEGHVVLAGRGLLRALDLRTGQELWRAGADALDDVQPVTDGTFLLATGTALGVGRSISAVSLRDGSLLWRTTMPDGGESLRVVAGHVVAVGQGVVIGLG